jgi:hypothetical protein
MRFWWLVLALSGSIRLAHPDFLLVRVLEDGSAKPLPNAEVIDLGSGLGRFTNSDGVARLPWPPSAPLRLRVRQLGFKPVDRVIDEHRDSFSTDTVTVLLERVVFALPPIVSRETQRCDATDSAATFRAFPALEQLRLGAERYERFRNVHPFRVEVERRTVTLNGDGKPKSVRRNTGEADALEWGDPYLPGQLIRREPLGFSVAILFLATLADSSFWANHCFTVRGISAFENRRVVEMEFAPAIGAPQPEWQGTALIDSATSTLTRLQFQLSGLPADESPQRFEGYTTFMSPAPYIVIPDSTVAYWWRRGPSKSGEWSSPDVVQLLRVLNLKYRDGQSP